MGLESQVAQECNEGAMSKQGDRTNEAGIAGFVALQRIGRELNSTLDMDQILDLLIHQTVDVTPATHGSVILFDKEEQTLQPRAWYGYTAQQIEALSSLSRLSRGDVVRRALSSSEIATIDDVSQDPDYVPVVESTRSELAAPICYGQEVVGVLDLESPLPCAFGDNAVRFVSAIAEQAAIAIGNARRHAEQVERENAARRRNAQLRDLIAISHALHTGHDLDDVLDRIVQAIPYTGGFNVALLSLVSGDLPMLCRVAAAGVPLEVLEELKGVQQPLQLVEHILQERYQISRSYFLPHQESEHWEPGLHTYTVLQDSGLWQEGEWHPGDVLLVPLRDSQGALLGLLSVDDPEDGRVPTRESIEILELFASQAASAIENARLYDELEMRVRKRTQELAAALRQQALEADKTRAIVESISDAVIVFDASGDLILANPSTARVLGLEASRLIHCNLFQADFGASLEKDREMAKALFQAAKSAREELSYGQDLVKTVFQAARRVIHAGFSPVALTEGEPLTMVAVFRDITHEAELDRMKSEFISMAAHELRTPMASITGYVDLLMLGMLGPVNEKQTEFLQVVKANAQRLMTLVNDLLDISKIDSEGLIVNLRPVSLADVVSEAVAGMRKQIEAKDQDLAIEVPTDLPQVMADRDLMIQVVTNLLSNANKYSPIGSQLAIQGNQVNEHLVLEVRDRGIGISPADRERLFTRFFRADNAIATQESGTGLGLAICREILARHGAEIEVDSELGQGTVFRIRFPPEVAR